MFSGKMLSRASPRRTFLSLLLCLVVTLVAFELHYSVISYLYLTEIKTAISQQPDTASEVAGTSNHPTPSSKNLKGKHKTTYSNERKILTVYRANRGNEEEVPPLPSSLPYAKYLKSIDEIQQAPWTRQLYKFLTSLDRSISPHVNMVFGDSNHIMVVLNWIIAAHVRLNPPLHNILVLSVDQPLCDFIKSKKLPVACIAVPPESFLASTGPDSYQQGIKTRFVVLRVMNFWGYDVASYDCDAIVLRNPQHLYDSHPDVQVFAGSSYGPKQTPKVWNFSLCAGALFVRSHPSTERVWNYIHNSTKDECEQCLWNHAMAELGVRYNKSAKPGRLCRDKTGWQSYELLASIVFPQKMFCRLCCEKRYLSGYYVVHIRNAHLMISLKRQSLKEIKSWFLQPNWRDSSSLEGNSWLTNVYMM